MSTVILQEIGRPRDRRPQLISQLRTFIHEHGLRSGDCLPPENTLARQFGVSRMTLRAAADSLIREELLERRQGSGTYIRSPVKTTIALVSGSSPFAAHVSLFWQWVNDELRRSAAARQAHIQTFSIDPDGHLDEAGLKAIRDHQIEGAILFGVPVVADRLKRGLLARFEQAGIPAVGFLKHEPETLYRVYPDDHVVLDAVMSRAARAGHRTLGAAGWILGGCAWYPPLVREAATAHALRLDPAWLLTGDMEERDPIRRGRTQFAQYAVLPEKPAALVFTDHYEALGFMYGQLAQTRQIPDSPALLLMEASNTVLDLPWPVIRVQFDLRPILERALEVLFDLMHGRPVPSRAVVLKPVIHAVD